MSDETTRRINAGEDLEIAPDGSAKPLTGAKTDFDLIEKLKSKFPVVRYFAFDHLRSPLREISARYHDIALGLAETLPRNAESSTALRKLLESKDAAVRAALP